MQDKLQGIESPAVTERRAFPRLRVTSLVYIDTGNLNGGIVSSLSENGLALTAAADLRNGKLEDGPLKMRIQFPGIAEAIEATGQIVWTSSSGKEARVRFVEIGEKARAQIRGWMATQAPTNGLAPEQRKIPRMQLPTARGAKARGLRFSFADVASSRIDAEGEPGIEDSLENRKEPVGLPPLQVAGVAFGAGTKTVASAFERPALAENHSEETKSAGNARTTPADPNEDPQRQPPASIPERRQHSRRQILLFTYAVLGEDNGGLVFNLGEGGLALTAAASLRAHDFAKIRVRFPDAEDWIETSGRLAWKSNSGKEAGIEFVSLPEDARARIREWVSQGERDDDLQSREGEVQASQNRDYVSELPSFVEPEGSSTQFTEIPAPYEEQPSENQTFEEHAFAKRARTTPYSSALFRTGIKGILERASVKRRVSKIKPPGLPYHSARPRTRAASKAVSIAAGVALAVGGWMFLQRTSLNKVRSVIARNVLNTEPSQEPAQNPDVARTKADAVAATADTPIRPSEPTETQTGIPEPSIPQPEPSIPQMEGESSPPNASKAAVAGASANPDRRSREKSRSEETLLHTRDTRPPRSLYQAQGQAPSQLEQLTKPPQNTLSAPAPSPENKLVGNKPTGNKPVENKSVQIAQAFPKQNKDLDATPPAPNSNPSPPAAAPPVDLAKEKPFVQPKQPEASISRTPVVTVSFDPFPSIRMPKAEKSRKSHQGKSLQMGRLLSRVDPVYPEEARQQGIEGTARVHAIFSREGDVQSVISLSGPPLLVSATMRAVRQWHYSQTILGGQAMETEEDVTVLFRLDGSASRN